MKIMEVDFLPSRQKRRLPFWAGLLPANLRERYVLRYRPALWSKEEERIRCILQTDREGYFSRAWREKTKELLEGAKGEGAAIVLSDLAADLPQEILPFARGQKLSALFGAEGALPWLKRRGIRMEEAVFLLADGGGPEIFHVLETLPLEIGRLGILTERAGDFWPWQERLLAERGLALEMTPSCGQDIFRQADVVLSWQKGGSAMAYALKKEAFFLDLAGNEALCRRLADVRPDVRWGSGLIFSWKGRKMEGPSAEAEAFLTSPAFRLFFSQGERAAEAKEALEELGVFPIGPYRPHYGRKKGENQG